MASSTPDLHSRILDLEEATWRALQSSGAAMIPFITEDCIMQFPLGMKLTATTEPSVKGVLHSPAFVPWTSFELSQVDVTPVGRDGAVISYMARATRPPAGKEERATEFEALCSSVWRLEGGKYAMCFHQQALTT